MLKNGTGKDISAIELFDYLSRDYKNKKIT